MILELEANFIDKIDEIATSEKIQYHPQYQMLSCVRDALLCGAVLVNRGHNQRFALLILRHGTLID